MTFSEPPLEATPTTPAVFHKTRARRYSLTPFKEMIVKSWEDQAVLQIPVSSDREAGEMIRRLYQASDRLSYNPPLGVSCSKIYMLDGKALTSTQFRKLHRADKLLVQFYVGFAAKLRSFKPRHLTDKTDVQIEDWGARQLPED